MESGFIYGMGADVPLQNSGNYPVAPFLSGQKKFQTCQIDVTDSAAFAQPSASSVMPTCFHMHAFPQLVLDHYFIHDVTIKSKWYM